MTITKYLVNVSQIKDKITGKIYYYNKPIPFLGKGKMEKLLKKGRIRAEVEPIPLIKLEEVPKIQPVTEIIKRKTMAKKKNKIEFKKPTQNTYGQLLILMAILVGIPRWGGAMFAADNIGIFGWLADMFTLLYGVSGFGMAVLEVLSIGYVFGGLREQAPFVNGRPNSKYWIILFFAILILGLIPLILVPFMVAQILDQDVSVFLQDINFIWQWITAVVIAPLIIIGGVFFAREGLMDAEVPETKAERAKLKRNARDRDNRAKKKAEENGEDFRF